MKTLTFVLILAAICGAALCYDRSETHDTPLGEMNMEQLLEIYFKYRYLKYNFANPDAIKLINSWIEKVEDIIYSRETPRNLRRTYEEFRGLLESFVNDLNDNRSVGSCGFETVAQHHMRALRIYVKNLESDTVKNLCETFIDEIRHVAPEPEGDADLAVYRFMKNDQELWNKVSQIGRLKPRCSKYID